MIYEKIVNKEEYISRLINKLVEKYLDIFRSIYIKVPKWCWKSQTSSYHVKCEFLVGDPKSNFLNRKFVEIDSYSIFKETPHLIDE